MTSLVSLGEKTLEQKRFRIILVLAAGCVAAVVIRLGPLPQLAPPELLPLSKQVAKISADHMDYYAWQSNDSFLKFEFYPHPGMMQIDVRTGAEVSLTSLQRRAGKAVFDAIAISPDGKKALWEDWGDTGPRFYSTSLEGSPPLSRTLLSNRFWTSASNPVWMPDNKRWIQLFAAGRSNSAVVCEDGKAKAVQEINIGNPQGKSSGYDLMHTHLLGVTHAGRVLGTPERADSYPNAQRSRHIDFFEFSLDSAHPNVREYTIELPKGEKGHENDVALAGDEEVELSPHGDQLAWLVQRRIEFPVQRWFSRWLPGKITTSRLVTELRITNLDGTIGRTVGMIARKSNQSLFDEGPFGPFGMHWLPDGQHISFIFNGSLWVVPTH